MEQQLPITKRMRTPVGFVRVNAELTDEANRRSPISDVHSRIVCQEGILMREEPRLRNCDSATASRLFSLGLPSLPVVLSRS